MRSIQLQKLFKPQKSYSVYEYKLRQFPDRFKEEELLKVDGNPQNQIMNVEKWNISKLICYKVRGEMEKSQKNNARTT